MISDIETKYNINSDSRGSTRCPHCNEVFPITVQTLTFLPMDFYTDYFSGHLFPKYKDEYNHLLSTSFYKTPLNNEPNDRFILEFYRCPSCKKPTIKITNGRGSNLNGFEINIFPKSNAIQFPEYIPQPIRNDYEEACAILDLSPKSSATLSRRCLQGMIRDFWGVSKKTLGQEITAIKDKVTASQWDAMDKLREIGNIGAHMEKDINLVIDIDPNEAQQLIKMIEYLLKEWYISRHDSEVLMSDIIGIAADKKNQKASGNSNQPS